MGNCSDVRGCLNVSAFIKLRQQTQPKQGKLPLRGGIENLPLGPLSASTIVWTNSSFKFLPLLYAIVDPEANSSTSMQPL
ncbi:hypothetical protein GDO78_016674 [Eleutherodactylus coqui]|uniref:Uncharacterized protein n=1 Tax=Eleutherodactylus coqui TaxID=57060 RepID=A0A8J6BFD8_ELECQ|nr:hypothetical protein GDO78_016674 [Eleutherodactylus coqui]